MSLNNLSKTFEHLRQTLPLPDEDALTDSELLTRFINRRDQAAFAALFRRHSPMVLTVCRRVLGHIHDAEDALQATFLLLARKAKRVMKRESLGSFLYGVAYRTALEAKTLNEKRKKREKLMASVPLIEMPAQEIQDWYPLLYRELNRLPEKYREPIVLCDLEGRSRKHVATQLNVPEGTLSSRLATARNMLARRLCQRGVELSAGLLATVLAQEAASAPLIPTSLVASTTTAATSVAAGKVAAVTIPAVVLMKGVLQAMFLTKLKIAASIVLAAVVLGASGFAYRSKYVEAGPPENKIQAAPPEVKRPPSELEALRSEMELIKLNLRLLVEKVQAQEGEVRRLKERFEAVAAGSPGNLIEGIQRLKNRTEGGAAAPNQIPVAGSVENASPGDRTNKLRPQEHKSKTLRVEDQNLSEVEGEIEIINSKIKTAEAEVAVARLQSNRIRKLAEQHAVGQDNVQQTDLALTKAMGALEELKAKRSELDKMKQARQYEELKAQREQELKLLEIEGEIKEIGSKIRTAQVEIEIARSKFGTVRQLVEQRTAGVAEMQQAKLMVTKAECALDELVNKRNTLTRKLALLREPLKRSSR